MPGTYFKALLAFTILAVSGGMPAQPSGPVTIGMVIDGPWEQNQPYIDLFESEIRNLMSGEFDIRFPADKRLTADWTLNGIRSALDQLLNDPEVDILLAMGTIASHEVSVRGPLPKPVIAPFILDVGLQSIPQSRGASGVKNLSYIAIPSTLVRDITAFRTIVPFSNLVMFVNGVLYEAVPGLEERFRGIISDIDYDIRIVPVFELNDALSALHGNPEAVYIAPLLNLGMAGGDQLIDTLIARKIPGFSLLGRNEVERGVLAALNPDIFPRMARRVALNCQRILLGEKPSEIPFGFAAGEELAVNMKTARAIGIYPPWEIITEAVLIDSERSAVERVLTFNGAIKEGTQTNLDLLAKEREVAAGSKNVSEARANLLPRLEISATGVQIDADRAGTFQAEQTVTGTATLTQILFADDAWANLSVQKHLQRGLRFEQRTLTLDIGQVIATAYLQLLQAKTFESIQRDNLRLSRSNLELARVRESVGYSGPADIYRWQSEIASNRRAVIDANAQRNLAEIQLNRLLNRPLEESFATVEEDQPADSLLNDRLEFLKYMNDPWTFKIFRRFLVEEGLASSPEIRQLDAAIAARERLLKNTTRAYFLPDIALQAEVSHFLYQGGEGSEDPALPADPALAGLLMSFDTGDDTNWNVALNASYPLFSGGARYAQRGRALETLMQLRTERKSLSDKIEQRIRSAAHLAGASYAGIRQSREAAKAADRNLELVVDSYSNGLLSITQLLDAQNAARIADEAAANAVYDFLIDLMEVERSIGILECLMPEAEHRDFFKRANAYFEAAGVELK